MKLSSRLPFLGCEVSIFSRRTSGVIDLVPVTFCLLGCFLIPRQRLARRSLDAITEETDQITVIATVRKGRRGDEWWKLDVTTAAGSSWQQETSVTHMVRRNLIHFELNWIEAYLDSRSPVPSCHSCCRSHVSFYDSNNNYSKFYTSRYLVKHGLAIQSIHLILTFISTYLSSESKLQALQTAPIATFLINSASFFWFTKNLCCVDSEYKN